MLRSRASVRTAIALSVAFSLLTAACGSEDIAGTLAEGLPTAQASPDSAATEPSNDPDPDPPLGDGVDALLAVLSDTGESGSFRVSATTGQTLRSSALGLDQVQEADPARPTTIVEVAENGDSYIFVDLGPVFAALAAGDPVTAAALDATQLRMWTSADSLVIDSTGYQAVADLNPGADLGPFTPGIGVVDLNRLGGLGGADLAEALVGNVASPMELAARLPTALDDIAQDPDNALIFTATASYSAMIEATGGDVQTAARGVAVGIAPAIGLSVDELAAFYERYYGSVQADLVITATQDGRLASIGITTDLSSVYSEVFSATSGLDLGMSEADLTDTREQFADTVWIIETLSTFEFDDSIVVAPPSGDFEDRTELALTFFAELLPG